MEKRVRKLQSVVMLVGWCVGLGFAVYAYVNDYTIIYKGQTFPNFSYIVIAFILFALAVNSLREIIYGVSPEERIDLMMKK